jgi:GNAT superfamily N-acetyltransferase
MLKHVTRLFEDDVRESDVGDMLGLLKILRQKGEVEKVTHESLRRYARDNYVFITRDETGHIVGMATLVFWTGIESYRGDVRDVVVAETHRQQGIARRLMMTIIGFATAEGLPYLKLTSNEDRVEAHRLYGIH